ncbi:MAG: 30S ribosomal protein S6 [Candidatus Dormibacteria bacterium]
MVRDYELMYIVRPELDEEALQGAIEAVEKIIAGAGGTVVSSTSWGRRRLAYEVKHLRDGHYMLLHVQLEGGRVAEVERALTISETVFRHLLVLGSEVSGDSPAPADDGGTTSTRRQAPVAAADEVPAAALTVSEEA